MQIFARYCFAITLLLAFNASASVVMTGTRIIFPSSAKEKTLQFTNTDAVPYLMQVNITQNDESNVTEETNQATPFIVSPAIFRIEAHSGQSVRLNWIGSQLPADRESLFYLTFHQIPATSKTESNKNKLLVAVSSKVKLFYRPVTLGGARDNPAKNIIAHINNQQLILDNPTGYYISIKTISLNTENNHPALAEGIMIAPKSTLTLSGKNLPAIKKGQKIKIITINDYGTESITETELN